MLKNFLLKKMLRTKGVPEQQIDMEINKKQKNPEHFKIIATEIQAKVKTRMDQNTAALQVFKKYENELKKLA